MVTLKPVDSAEWNERCTTQLELSAVLTQHSIIKRKGLMLYGEWVLRARKPRQNFLNENLNLT